MKANHAFESGRTEKQRAFCFCPWRRAAQRERSPARHRRGVTQIVLICLTFARLTNNGRRRKVKKEYL